MSHCHRHRTANVMLGPRPLAMRPSDEADAIATWATFALALMIFLAGVYVGFRSATAPGSTTTTTANTGTHAHAATP